ncbi:MAG TPA: diguanylate cyclase [Azospirillum sp.]|nr:diguanylate cyclase [Azospirillum sp.]
MAQPIVGQWLIGLAAVLFWAALTGGSLAYNLHLLDHQTADNALARGRILFKMIETTRLWNAERGGVYAPVSAHTPPNPLLEDPDRDVEINGTPYTKVNPAYMTRQIAELVRKGAGVTFNITSLAPINPDNMADPWERRILQSFAAGKREVLERVDETDGPNYRYMAALVTHEECLQCHVKHGYKVGDVRGGISITIPGPFVQAEIAPQRQQTIVLHGIAFAVLSALSLLFLNRLHRHWQALEGIVDARTAELKQANEALQRIALYDQLTGLCSRTLFEERLRRALQRAERSGSLVALTYVDLNNFKPINDTYGHPAGDVVLRAMAQRMQDAIRKVDTVARVGGDEFVIIMEDLDDREGSIHGIQRMLTHLAQPVALPDGTAVAVRASAGTAFYPTDAEAGEALIAAADAAMYRAKHEQHAAPDSNRHVLAGSNVVTVPV